ncbi:MAG: hypothetical protein SFX73_32155 [Kofleriaceae bacterium]|nr:hypothetical protein [Kofleriaceae bacterium]
MKASALLLFGTLLATTTAHANGGLESDVIGWASGGYHGSLWYGTEKLRVRIVKAVFYAPGFTVPDGFEDLRNEAWEFFIDTAWRPRGARFQGLWSGVGLELYDRELRDEASGATARFDALELALRTGYIWHPFSAGFYLNPWIGLNVRVDGADSVLVGERTYTPTRLTPLASLKLGWRF